MGGRSNGAGADILGWLIAKDNDGLEACVVSITSQQTQVSSCKDGLAYWRGYNIRGTRSSFKLGQTTTITSRCRILFRHLS